MKAVLHERYGSPDVLEFRDVPTPTSNDDEVLVEIHAASINALDWHATRGMPYVLRLDGGLRKPKHMIRGVDLAGRVVAVGSNVKRIKVGDAVFGGSNGSLAEYTVTTEDRLAHKPAAFTYEEAAALHVAGMTALQGLTTAGVRSGQRVLVNGAGGGVGTFAVQIAKLLGAHVTAVTRASNIELVHSLGADEAIAYDEEDYTRRGERYDVVFDISGDRPLRSCVRVTSDQGVIVVVGSAAGRWLAPATRMIKASVLAHFVRPRLIAFMSKNDLTSLLRLAELAASGQLRTVIDRRYTLEDAPDAIKYVGSAGARGKVVVTVR